MKVLFRGNGRGCQKSCRKVCNLSATVFEAVSLLSNCHCPDREGELGHTMVAYVVSMCSLIYVKHGSRAHARKEENLGCFDGART